MPRLLSKSKYIRGLQCHRALWLDVFNPRLARYSREQMRRFDLGRNFEYAYKALYPQGVDVSADLGRRFDDYPALTAQLLDANPSAVLFEAGFLFDDMLVLSDVVCSRPDGSLDVYEVKSGNILTDTYRRDAAVQYYVVSHCRSIHSFSVVHANAVVITGSEEATDAAGAADDPRFAVVDLTDELRDQVPVVATNIAAMKAVLAGPEPDMPTGQHCLEPYACPYQHYCAQGVRQLSIF